METLGEKRHGDETLTSRSLRDVKSTKGFKLVHMNARSLLHNLDEINVCFLDGAFDAVVLTETWLHSNVSEALICNPDYTCTRLDRQTTLPSGKRKSSGGICIYTKNHLTFEVITHH